MMRPTARANPTHGSMKASRTNRGGPDESSDGERWKHPQIGIGYGVDIDGEARQNIAG